MTQYLLSVYYDEGAVQPPADDLARIVKNVDAVHQELRAQGAWIFGGGLHDPTTATVVRARNGQVLTTDGPFVETKEQLGGFSIIDVADLDAALAWAEKMSDATTCAIEVRPLVDEAPN
ncbi:MAG: hypothetical protein GEU74_16575 [Nitriliruptorales bacterium]|nr:hypothetical protein [Nitriliruptorales bacterium]